MNEYYRQWDTEELMAFMGKDETYIDDTEVIDLPSDILESISFEKTCPYCIRGCGYCL